MMKIFKLAIPAVIVSALLAGCSTSAGFQPVKITKPVSWDTELAETFKKDGWNVVIMPSESQKKQIPEAPTMFSALKGNECVVSYSSEPFMPKNFSLGEKFNTEMFIIDRISLVSLETARQLTFNTMQSKVANSGQKIDMLYSEYVAPYFKNGTPNPELTNEAPPTKPQTVFEEPDGEIYSFIAARNFSSTMIDNPFAELGEQYGSNVNKEITSAVYIEYKCLNKELDTKIIDMIKNQSTLVLK